MLRRELAVAFGLLAFAIGVACSSSDAGSSSSSSSGGASSSGTATGKAFHQCPPANTPAACSSADVDGYNTCVAKACDTQFQQCYGADYKAGTFGGAGAKYIACQQKCSCADSQCIAACGASPTSCDLTTCANACTLPACFTAGSSTSSSSSSSSGSTGPHTCAQLTTCCAKIADTSEQAQCNGIAASGVDAGSDTACDIAYDSFSSQAEGGCD